jgi:nitrosocyanin
MIRIAFRSIGIALVIGTMATASIARAQGSPAAASTAAVVTVAPELSTPGEKKFTLVAEQAGDTKFWFPSTIVVEPGDKVTLNLKNEIPGTAVTHGFALSAFNISEIVTRGEKPKVVHFTADKPGIYPYFCQLHPAHVGGQLVVEPVEKGGVSPAMSH